MDTATAHEFRCHFSAVQAEVKAGVVPSRATAADQHWRIWTEYCLRHSLDPTLEGIEDPVTFIQSLRTNTDMGSSTPARNKSDLAQWKMQNVPLARRLPLWGPRTHV